MDSAPLIFGRERERPRVVILGAGFAGLQTAKRLKRAPVEVVVVDRHNHHLFQPLLYQVATGGLSTQQIAAPIRKILRRQANASVLYAEATGFDLEQRHVLLGEERLEYDFLVVACGMTHGYFGHDEWAERAPGLKTMEDATLLRGRILAAFEHAERVPDPAERRRWSTFVIVGAGPTGVEMAGAIAELARHTLPRDFRKFDPREARVLLVEGLPHVLPTYPEELSLKAKRQLEQLGVEVRTGTMVTEIEDGAVTLGNERIESKVIIWAAGVATPPILAALPGPKDRAGRIQVLPTLNHPDHPEVFVIGDAASLLQDGKPVPGVAPAAIQMGRHTAKNIRRQLAGRPLEPFRYFHKGSLATIGRAAGVADFGKLRFGGLLAWFLWLFVHLLFLVGFRSRLVVLYDWAWEWLSYQRVARAFEEPARVEAAGPPRRDPPGSG